MRPPKGKVVETLVVNGCECEPYLTCDHRIMLEKTDQLLRGVRIAMKATGVGRAMIGVEDNKLDAVAAIAAKLPADGSITVHAVETKYPQGAEKMLIESLLGRQVPPGGLPADAGVMVFNVGTLAQMGELLPRGRGLIERVVTVSGPAVQRPGNYLVPMGTPIRFLLEHVGATPDANEVILGGPMMGMSVASVDVPVTKAVSGIVVYAKGDADQHKRFVFPCIKCSRCVEACPMHLNPSMLGQLARKREYEQMEQRFNLNDCFECGCCAYVCPSNIPLTQYFRIAKAINRERKQDAARQTT
jgi:electron transport complex protein RnfC